MGDAIPAVSIITAAAAVSGAAATLAPDAGVTRQPEGSPFVVIYVFLAVFSPVFITMLAIACLRLFHVPGAGEGAAPPERSHRGPRGLDAAAIAALPLLHYREVRRHRIVGADGGDALECSVCLLEFDDDDALRLLPMCPHVFHPECIGLWLERHATCPLCRASLLDAPAPQPQPQPQPQTQPVVAAAQPPDPSPDHPIVVLIGDREDEDDLSRIQCLARNRRAAGRQALPRSNSTGHDGVGVASNSRSMERFELLLPEHVRLEIIMSHRLRHVTSSVESVRVREDSAHGSSVGGSVRSAVARLLSRFAPDTGRKGDGGDDSVKAEDAGASSLHRWENPSRGAVGEEKRSV